MFVDPDDWIEPELLENQTQRLKARSVAEPKSDNLIQLIIW